MNFWLVNVGDLWAIKRIRPKFPFADREEFYYFPTMTNFWFEKDAACFQTGCWTNEQTARSVYERMKA